MMRADVLNSHIYPVRIEMSGVRHIPIWHVCYTEDNKSKEFLVDVNLLQVCSTDKGESKSVIADEIYMEESESECVHKSVNK